MWFLFAGVVLVALKLIGISPVAQWAWDEYWWAFALPFVAAAVWWWVADFSGLTSRQAMAKDQARRDARRQRNIEALGISVKKKR